MACDNPPMTGDGEINFTGTDAYTGVFTMHAPQFDMQINLTGKKIGTCENPKYPPFQRGRSLLKLTVSFKNQQK